MKGSKASSADTFRRIVKSARTLLAEVGQNNFSMREVADRAGITAGAIYRHFDGRAELIDHVVRTAFDSYELELTRAISAHPVGSFARLVAMGNKHMELARTHSEEFKILYSTSGSPRKLSDLPHRGGYDLLRQCIVEAMESGAMRRGDPDLTAFFLWTRVHGIVMLLLACDFSEEPLATDEPLTPERAFAMTRSLALYGIAADDR